MFREAVRCREPSACSVVVSQMPTTLPQLCEGRYGRDAGGSEQRTRGGRRQCGWVLDAGSTQGPGRLGCSVGEEGTRRCPEGHGGSGWDPKPLPGEQPCLFGDHGRLASGMMGCFSFPRKTGLGVQGGVLKKGLLSGNRGKGRERCERFTGCSAVCREERALQENRQRGWLLHAFPVLWSANCCLYQLFCIA